MTPPLRDRYGTPCYVHADGTPCYGGQPPRLRGRELRRALAIFHERERIRVEPEYAGTGDYPEG